MSMSDPLGDMLTRIRNGQQARKATIVSRPPRSCAPTCWKCCSAKAISAAISAREPRTGVAELDIELKYHEGEPVIREITRVSQPGRRVYSKIADLPRVFNGLGISILSTPRGVMSDNEARAANVGGEVLCRVF